MKNKQTNSQASDGMSWLWYLAGAVGSSTIGALVYYNLLEDYIVDNDIGTAVFGGFVGIFIAIWISIAVVSLHSKYFLTASSLMIVGAIIVIQIGKGALIENILFGLPVGAFFGFCAFIVLAIIAMVVTDEEDESVTALVEILINESGEELNKTLDTFEEFSNQGKRLGLKALEEAIKKLSGNGQVVLYEPGKSSLTAHDLETNQAKHLVDLASKGQLLEDTYKSSKLIMAFYRSGGDADRLHADILAAGGKAQERAFVLLQNYSKCCAHYENATADRERLNCPSCSYSGEVGDFKTIVLMGDVPGEMYGAKFLACPRCEKLIKRIGSISDEAP